MHPLPAAAAPRDRHAPTVEILAFTAQQVCAAIQIDEVTLWRLEKRGLIRRVPGLRHRRYTREEVRRFLDAA